MEKGKQRRERGWDDKKISERLHWVHVTCTTSRPVREESEAESKKWATKGEESGDVKFGFRRPDLEDS